MSMRSFSIECRVMQSDSWVAFIQNDVITHLHYFFQSVVVFHFGDRNIPGHHRIGIHSCLINLRQDKSFHRLFRISIIAGFLVPEL